MLAIEPILEKFNSQDIIETVKITIETRIEPNINQHERVCGVKLRSIESTIAFPKPVIFDGWEYYIFNLITSWNFKNHTGDPAWYNNLKGSHKSNRYIISSSGPFNELNGPFDDYSQQKLQKWQNGGIKEHFLYLRKLEALFLEDKGLTKDFFNLT